MTLRGALGSVLMLPILASPAAGQSLMSAAETKQFAAFRKSESYQKRRFKAVLEAKQALWAGSCTGRQQIKIAFRGPYVPVRFKKGRKEPVEGAWAERVQYVACPDVPPINLVVVARNDKPVDIFRSVPGHTLADPFLVEKVSAPLGKKAKAEAKKRDCKRPPTMKSTSLISRPDKNGKWAERWTVNLCGKSKAYRVDFRPKPGGGTTFAIGALGAKAK